MRIRHLLFFIPALILATLVAGAAAADPVAWHDRSLVADLSFGIFCNQPADRQSDDPATTSGTVGRFDSNPVQLRQTQTVPAIGGVLFGVIGREQPASDDEVTIEVVHPPLGAQGITHESWTTEMQGNRATFHGYFLDLADGDPVGRWIMSGTRSGRTLFQVEFDVIGPTLDAIAEQERCSRGQIS